MPVKLAVVCEAEADFRTATELAERVFQEEVDWVDADLLRECPLWHGPEPALPFFRWKDIGGILRSLGLPKPRGHFGEDPIAPYADQARTALVVLRRLYPEIEGVLLVRDDDREERRRGLEQARTASSLRERIVIGLAKSERECWVLAGFDPCDATEQGRLDSVRQELGFDPRLAAERLDTHRDNQKRSAKRVLLTLVGEDQEREARCWRESRLDMLRVRGERSGLKSFLDEVKERLVPLFTGAEGR
jgi:hypothetical protein